MPEILEQLRTALADRYTIDRELGRGGMALVFLATDLKHHRPVAIKVLTPELAAALGSERFLREIEIAARLTHPHILPLHDSGDAGGLLYYVMPYVEGESLRERLDREKQLPIDDAVQIVRQVASALSYAHGRHVVHRDIKPENILLEGGEAVVADFGIARAVTEAGGARLTGTGIALGTPLYMSPEQAAGERQLDGRSDVYSLGCVLYELLAGQPPFTGPTVESIIHQHLTAEAPAVSAIRAGAPEPVAAVIRRALAKTPADRFTTAAQFAEALSSPGVAARRAPGPERARWRRRLAAGASLGVLVAASAVALVLARRRPRVVPTASMIAVVPLAPTTSDTGLARLGRDLVVTLSASLDRVGEIRTVDALAILAQAKGVNEAYTRQEGAALARRLGASSVVHGSLLRIGQSVRLDLGLFATDGLSEIAHASVTAPSTELNALTDSATWTLLRQVWQAREPPTPSLAAITTRSVPALRAFLDGERAVVDGRWQEATDAFGRAVQADSTFWLAYSRYAYARSWGEEPDSAVVGTVRRHRLELPERERLLDEARDAPSSIASGERLRQIAERFPAYWPGLMEYADWLVHFGPLLGFTSADARAALEQTVAVNPRLIPAWTHLLWMDVLQGDTAGSGNVIAALTGLGYEDGQAWERMDLLRQLDQLLRARDAADRSRADSLVRRLGASPDPSWEGVLLWLGMPREQIALSSDVLAGSRGSEVSAWRRAGAMAWAARGAWDSAIVAMDRNVRAAPNEAAALDAYGLAVVGVWLGAASPSTALARREAAARAGEGGTAPQRAELAWLDGVLAAARHDAAALAAARSVVRRSRDPGAWALEESLRAFAMQLTGARDRAARAMAALEWRLAERTVSLRDPDSLGENHPYAKAIHRLAASRWLLAEADTLQAARLLTWYEEIRWPALANAIVAALAFLDQARIEDARGQTDLARRHYEEFLRRYDMPVATHQHLVEEARSALARLAAPAARSR